MQKGTENTTVTLTTQKETEAPRLPITELKKIKELWDELFTIENLRDIYFSRIKSDKMGKPKKSVGLDFVTTSKFEEDLEENLNIIVRKVKNGTYKFTRYKLLLINKGPGKAPREIRIPTIRDRITHTAMADFARKVLGLQCEIPNGKNIIRELIKERKNYTGFSKSDISQFFKSINHELLQNKLEEKFQDKDIITLFMKAVSTESYSDEFKVPKFEGFEWERTGVPEGLSFSGFIANAFLEEIDLKYKKIPNIKYYRFVDDILILSSKEDSDRYSSMLHNDFSKLKLKINAEKASDASKAMSFEYLGYVFDEDKITIRQKSVAKIESRIANLIKQEAKHQKKLEALINDKKSEDKENQEKIFEILKFGERPFNERLNNQITGFKINNVHYSWVNYYSLINDYTLMGKFDALVKNLLERYGLKDLKPKKHLKALLECKHNPDSTYIPDYTYIRSISLKEGDEEINIQVTSDLAKQIAKQIGWNTEAHNENECSASAELKEDFKAALKLAITEGFSFDKQEDKYFINMKKFKLCIQKAISKAFSDSKEI